MRKRKEKAEAEGRREEEEVGPKRDRAAYMRWYRARRKANKGKPIGGAKTKYGLRPWNEWNAEQGQSKAG